MKSLILIASLVFSIVSLSATAQTRTSGYTLQSQVTDLQKSAKVSVTRVTSGTATSILNAAGPIWVVVDPASALAAHKLTLPSSPKPGQVVNLNFGGTLTTGTVVTSLTISPASSQTIIQTTAPSSASAGASMSYRFNAVLSKWFRSY